mmetsp:Transcript_50172/g.74481  ORF Transcript_50172/g.74481 Transcript_50172/m.74481 type:complete len:326 (+) Transcript_50172:314-1291(+)
MYYRVKKRTGRPGLQTEEQVRLLDNIAFNWVPCQAKMNIEKQWKLQIATLEQYRAQHGHCRVPMRYEDRTLAGWVERVRRLYHEKERGLKSTLTQDKIDQLTNMGFEFSISPQRRKKSWEERFRQLREFKRENGHCNVPCKYTKVLLLPRWVKEQRKQNRLLFEGKESKLTWEKFYKLDQLGFRFTDDPNERRCPKPWSWCTCDMVLPVPTYDSQEDQEQEPEELDSATPDCEQQQQVDHPTQTEEELPNNNIEDDEHENVPLQQEQNQWASTVGHHHENIREETREEQNPSWTRARNINHFLLENQHYYPGNQNYYAYSDNRFV